MAKVFADSVEQAIDYAVTQALQFYHQSQQRRAVRIFKLLLPGTLPDTDETRAAIRSLNNVHGVNEFEAALKHFAHRYIQPY